MNTNRNLDFLIRKNQGKLLLNDLKKNFSRFLSEDVINNIEFLSLNTSDNIRKQFLKEFKKNLYEIIYVQNINEISNIIICNKFFDIKEKIYLFFSISDKIGGMIINFEFFLKEVKNIIKLDNESIYILNLHKNKFIYIDKYIDDSKKDNFYYEILMN